MLSDSTRQNKNEIKNEIFNFQSQDGFVVAYIDYYERGSGMLKHHMLEGEAELFRHTKAPNATSRTRER
jgi:hypothetical protein